ncbi:hypothetical protein [Chitinophaga barathri]|uniref:Uncharacterized protein n=1 Tax=Chitinophaga barathri TaxID=1647451 RepID=A0A3N4N5J9_9BACT|nr:hypothetical protein [Chitinophaga barathri]RPD42893.1 hypothetical protein EG028_00925 [Chitinophaga barathri]
MVRKNILCCGLLAGTLFFASSFMNPAVTPATQTVASFATTDTEYFTLHGRSGEVSITYFTSGGIYSTPMVTIAGIGSYPMTNVSHSPGTPPLPNVDGFHVSIPGPDGDYIVDIKVHGVVNSWWNIAEVTKDFIDL